MALCGLILWLDGYNPVNSEATDAGVQFEDEIALVNFML
jgi:hypothetical protein